MQDLPGSPMVETSPSNAGGMGLIPGKEARIPQASQPKKQNIKQKQFCNKFNKDFKEMVHIKKKIFFFKVLIQCNRLLDLTSSHYQFSEKANGTPLQYSCLENPMDRGAW